MSHRFIDTPAIVWQDTPAIVWGEYTEATPNSFAPVYLVEITLPERVLNVALIVADATSLSATLDTPIKTYLEGLGHAVTVKDDDDSTYDPTGFDVVVISESVSGAKVGWLKEEAVGVVTVDWGNYDEFELATDSDAWVNKSQVIMDSNHYITREYDKDQTVEIAASGGDYGYYTGAGGDVKILMVESSAVTHQTLLAVEKGMLLQGGVNVAAERRVFFCGRLLGSLNAAGQGFFRRAVDWAAYNTESNITRYATRDYVSPEEYLYKGALLEAPVIRRSLSGLFYGVEQAESLTLRLANGDNGIDDTWEEIIAVVEVRGAEVRVIRYDSVDEGYLVEFRGTISAYRLTKGEVEFTVVDRDDAVLDTLLPKEVVTTDLFHATALDVGAAVNLCFGKCPDVPLPNIKNDTGASHYDYLVGKGVCQGIWEDGANGRGVKRNGVIVTTSEYTFYDGSQASPYPGCAFIRFTEKEQKDHGGAYHRLTADVYGLELNTGAMVRDCSDVIKAVLSDSVVGLGEAVNANSFVTAKAALASIGDMYCDGAVISQTRARDILDKLLEMCRGSLSKGSDGTWALSIDGAKVASLDLGDNDGFWNNCTVEEVSSTPANEALKSATVHYCFSAASGSPAYTMSIAIMATFGVDKVYEMPFVFEHATAKKVLSYLKNRSIYSDKRVRVVAGMDARRCLRGDVVTVTAPLHGFSEKTFVADGVSRSLCEFEVELREYDSHIFDDETITTPTNQTLPTGSSNGPNSLLGVGGNTFGANATNTIAVFNGTPPAGAVTDGIQIHSKDTAAGSATLALRLEQAVEAIGTFTPTHKLRVWINGTEYSIQLDPV